MGAVDDMIARWKRVDMSQIINTAVLRNENQVLNLNRQSQLKNRGIGEDGEQITPLYHPRTIQQKRQKGQTTKFVTLRDTGQFHENFKIIYRTDSIEITASPTNRNGKDLTIHLQGRYGKHIFGLIDENVIRTRKIIKPAILQQLRNV